MSPQLEPSWFVPDCKMLHNTVKTKYITGNLQRKLTYKNELQEYPDRDEMLV